MFNVNFKLLIIIKMTNFLVIWTYVYNIHTINNKYHILVLVGDKIKVKR